MRKKSSKQKARANGRPAVVPAGAPILEPVIDLEALNLYRLEQGVSFKELAARINIKPTTLYAVLRGRTLTKLRDTTAYRLQQFCATHGALAVDRHPR